MKHTIKYLDLYNKTITCSGEYVNTLILVDRSPRQCVVTILHHNDIIGWRTVGVDAKNGELKLKYDDLCPLLAGYMPKRNTIELGRNNKTLYDTKRHSRHGGAYVVAAGDININKEWNDYKNEFKVEISGI